MTGVDVAAIRARADAATEGPWFICADDAGHSFYRWDEDNYDVAVGDDSGNITDYIAKGGPVEVGGPDVGACEKADARFIAHARTDVPALLDALAEAERQRDDALAQIAQVEALIASFDPTSGSGRARAFVGDIRAALADPEPTP